MQPNTRCDFWRPGRYAVGLLMLLLVVAIWVSSSELMKYIFNNDFSKPFFITYLDTSLFSMYLLGFAFRKSWRDELPSWRDFWVQVRERISRKAATENDGERKALLNSNETSNSESTPIERMSVVEVLEVSFVFCLLWFAANYLFSLALAMSKVSSVTVLSATSGFFTLMLESVWAGKAKDTLSFTNFFLVALSVVGVGLVSYSDAQPSGDESSSQPNRSIGDALALASAFLYGCYLVFLQKRIGNEDRLDMAMFFGFVGLINTLLLWPFFLLLHYTGWETFAWPTPATWLYLLVNAAIGTALSDYLWLYSTLLTSPLIATLGLSLTIPLAVFADALVASVDFNVVFVTGTVLVFVAFIGINLVTYAPINDWLVEHTSPICGGALSRVLFGRSHVERETSTQ